MLANGLKIPHVHADNFISEMVDSFNVAAVQTGSGTKIAIIIGRDMLNIKQETMLQRGDGFATQALQEDVALVRHVVANLTVPLESAKGFLEALRSTIAQLEEQLGDQDGSETP